MNRVFCPHNCLGRATVEMSAMIVVLVLFLTGSLNFLNYKTDITYERVASAVSDGGTTSGLPDETDLQGTSDPGYGFQQQGGADIKAINGGM